MATTTALRWTSADLETLPDDGKRYEIIDGELFMSRSPHYEHQRACTRIGRKLDDWCEQIRLGEAVIGPGIIFADDDDVIPDVAWVSREQRDQLLDAEGHFRGAPELVIEVLSFTGSNARRDREAKLKLYSRRGVEEYWIVDWILRQVEIFRQGDLALELVATLSSSDTLQSPLLPGFSCQVKDIFADYLA
ncbi:MAG TPA: Uma2 family endonuclease [Blastocatellia bacterium]|nr:Uma2 family endonuclease [Blastocatellia bacterium]